MESDLRIHQSIIDLNILHLVSKKQSRQNRLRWFGYAEKKNNRNMVKKMSEIKVERIRDRDWPKKKWMDIIRKDI